MRSAPLVTAGKTQVMVRSETATWLNLNTPELWTTSRLASLQAIDCDKELLLQFNRAILEYPKGVYIVAEQLFFGEDGFRVDLFGAWCQDSSLRVRLQRDGVAENALGHEQEADCPHKIILVFS